MFIEAIDGVLVVQSTTVTGYFYISEIIEEFCKHVTFCLLFHVFFDLVLRFHQRAINPSKRSSRLKTILSLAIIVALSIVDWAYYIYLQNAVVGNPYGYFSSAYWIWEKIAAARCIVFLAVSVVIVSQAIFMTLRVKSRPLKVSLQSILPVGKYTDTLRSKQISAYLLLLGATFFFAWNLLWAIWAIRWYLASNIPNSFESTYMAQAITQCFLCLGTYLGLVLYCSKYEEKEPSWGSGSPGSTTDAGFSQSPTIAEVEASRAIFEADTKHPVPELDTSRPVVEADASRPIVEADS